MRIEGKWGRSQRKATHKLAKHRKEGRKAKKNFIKSNTKHKIELSWLKRMKI